MKPSRQQWYFIIIIGLVVIFGAVVGPKGPIDDASKKPEAKVIDASEEEGNSRPCNIPKKNGRVETTRCNDLEELCKDFYFFRKMTYKAAMDGDHEKAAKYRTSLNQVNRWLSEYKESDVQNMMTRVQNRL